MGQSRTRIHVTSGVVWWESGVVTSLAPAVLVSVLGDLSVPFSCTLVSCQDPLQGCGVVPMT